MVAISRMTQNKEQTTNIAFNALTIKLQLKYCNIKKLSSAKQCSLI